MHNILQTIPSMAGGGDVKKKSLLPITSVEREASKEVLDYQRRPPGRENDNRPRVFQKLHLVY